MTVARGPVECRCELLQVDFVGNVLISTSSRTSFIASSPGRTQERCTTTCDRGGGQSRLLVVTLDGRRRLPGQADLNQPVAGYPAEPRIAIPERLDEELHVEAAPRLREQLVWNQRERHVAVGLRCLGLT